MAGRPNSKWLVTMIAKFGSLEAVKEHMASLGARGGKNNKNGGFASEFTGKDGLTGYQRARIAGMKGGKVSKRKKQDA